MNRINILGLKFDDMDIAEAVERSLRAIEDRAAAYVLPVSSELLLDAGNNKRLMSALRGAVLILAGDKGIFYASKILGLPLHYKMSGRDYASALFARMSEKALSVFIFGGRPGAAELAGESMCRRYPGISVVGCASGDFVEDDEIIAAINEAAPDLLLMYLSSPRQEFWLYENCGELSVGMALALGPEALGSTRRENADFATRLVNAPGKTLKVPRAVMAALIKRLLG